MRSPISTTGGRLVALYLIASLPSVTHAQGSTVPDGELEVAYRQLDGRLSEAVFQNWMECAGGECTLTTLTLGQCIAGAFYPKIQRWSSRDGSLSVKLAAPGVVSAEFKVSGAMFQLRFTFESNGRRFGPLKGFSGGVVKQSDALEEVITWRLVPLRGVVNVKLGCPASLKGVPE